MTAGPSLGLRIAGLVLLALLITAGMATLIFPIVAGFLKLGMAPSVTGFSSLTAWIGFAFGDKGQPAHWLIFWTHLKFYLTGGYEAAPAYARAVTVTLALAGSLGLLCALGAAYRLWLARPALPTVTRRHMRGTTLVARADMPAFTASLVARALNPRDDRRRRRDERALAAIKPSDADVRSILTDAQDQKRELAKAEASADARMILIGDEAARHGLVRFGSVPMPPDVETLHSLICASTGTGKTVALRQLLGDIRRRGDRAIVLDAGHDLSRSFRRDEDLVLSAGDDGSLGWDLRNEVRKPSEWARFVAAVVPAIGSGESSEWTRKAQSFLTAICEQVGAETTNAELLEIATAWKADALAQILERTPAASLLAEGGDRYLISVRNNLGEKLASWKYGTSGDFSLRSYMTGDDRRWLWLPYRDMEKGTQGPAIAAWIDMLVLAGLERAEQTNTHRTWIIIDELDSIGTIGGLKEAVTRLRKSNVAVVAAIQDLSQLIERYGRETAQTLFGCFSNRLFLRCVASDLAEKVTKELGEAEYEETRTQTGQSLSRQSQRRTSKGENTSVSSQYTRSPVQLATEITNLPVRTGFVTFAGINRVLPINLSVDRRER
ncbi:hypothetical protein GGQ80_003567 [Sphingomonas jinjuensis]|uniref:Type IV secretion system coupling protein TraD DNA-binding domain-containing protein n=1 Tax=Sphingomonas jinjuensis TaxID=535907 RepID=A0A840FG51_9SPHN|nr:type IV secretion system DNA-binding domain-containing protein [Sphingomonas jinjuensis]MBB4155642.1 hypothetical protein [Sphingomonas jinjuensis]